MARAKEMRNKEATWRELRNSSAAKESYGAAVAVNREMVRGLLLLSHRVYLQSLHAIAGISGLDTFNAVVQESRGSFRGLVDMETEMGTRRGQVWQKESVGEVCEFSEKAEEKTGCGLDAVENLKRTWWGQFNVLGDDFEMPPLKRYCKLSLI